MKEGIAGTREALLKIATGPNTDPASRKIATDALALSTAPQGQAGAWQSIETAPKDGTLILLARAGGVWVGKYIPVYQSGYVPADKWHSHLLNHDHMAERYGKATHWMPLPQPPKDQEA